MKKFFEARIEEIRQNLLGLVLSFLSLLAGIAALFVGSSSTANTVDQAQSCQFLYSLGFVILVGPVAALFGRYLFTHSILASILFSIIAATGICVAAVLVSPGNALREVDSNSAWLSSPGLDLIFVLTVLIFLATTAMPILQKIVGLNGDIEGDDFVAVVGTCGLGFGIWCLLVAAGLDRILRVLISAP